MEQILAFIEQHGLPVFIIATCIILIIGTLKLCKVFSKIKNDNVKKCIYYILDVALSFAGVAIYYGAFKLDFGSYVMFSTTQIGATTTLYAIYENFGVRKLVQMFLAWIAAKIKKDSKSKLAKICKQMGLENFVTEAQAVITEKKEADEQAKAAANATANK